MNGFYRILSNILALAAGLLVCFGAFRFYNRTPLAWFREDDTVADTDPYSGPSPRMKPFPDGIWFVSVLVFVFFFFFIRNGISLVFFCNIFTLTLFAFIFVADMKTRIIPDQFLIGLLFASLLWMVSDISYIQEAGEAWYFGILERIPGGLAGGAVLWLIGAAGSFLLKREAMGMGDVKLAFVCGLVVGTSGIFWVIPLSFLFAFVPALIHLVRSRQFKQQIPFAPFLLLAATLYLLFPSEFALLFQWYRQAVF